MTTQLRRSAAIASFALVLGWSAPLASGSEVQPSDPRGPDSAPPTNSTSYSPAPSKFSLTVSPTRIVTDQAGIGSVADILVVNRGRSPIPVTVQKRNFTGGADGTLVFREDAPYSASDWVTVDPMSFVIDPGTSQAVTTSVTVAADPEPGDHQVAIVFLVPAGETGANVKINRGVAVPVYIAVTGPTDDSASLSDLHAPGFVMSGDVEVTAKVHNTGTIHRDFRGTSGLMVDVAGGTPAFPDFTVMRGATRDLATMWNPPLMCICHPTVSFVNADGTVQTATVRVIVFPLHLLGIAVGVLLVLGFAVRLRRRRRAAGHHHA